MLPCFFKSIFGIECLGCGSQRAMILLLKGELFDSFKMYPALIPFIFCITFTAIHLKYNFKQGPRVIVASFVISTAIMIGNYSIKFL